MKPRVALSMMPGPAFRAAALPLLRDGVVQGIEWTYELGFPPAELDVTDEALLAAFASAGALTLHGVTASPLGAAPSDFKQICARLRELTKRMRPTHLSEHFCFASTDAFRRTAPMPAPFTQATVMRARDRLDALSQASDCEVGSENLAFAFSRRDVEAEPEFLDAIVRPLGGFIVLDLHNLYCRARNFDLDPIELLARYPADLVAELHVSGGSESELPQSFGGGSVRRDTHDGAVPDEVFELASAALSRFPRLRQIVLERIPEALQIEADREAFRAEFYRLLALKAEPDLSPTTKCEPIECIASDDASDLAYQRSLIEAFESHRGERDVEALLRTLRSDSRTSTFSDELHAMEPKMLLTALLLHERWSAKHA